MRIKPLVGMFLAIGSLVMMLFSRDVVIEKDNLIISPLRIFSIFMWLISMPLLFSDMWKKGNKKKESEHCRMCGKLLDGSVRYYISNITSMCLCSNCNKKLTIYLWIVRGVMVVVLLIGIFIFISPVTQQDDKLGVSSMILLALMFVYMTFRINTKLKSMGSVNNLSRL